MYLTDIEKEEKETGFFIGRLYRIEDHYDASDMLDGKVCVHKGLVKVKKENFKSYLNENPDIIYISALPY
jgi:hypothetical protein